MAIHRGSDLYVLGAGGHAKVVISTLQAAGLVATCVFDDDANKWGSHILTVPIKGSLQSFQELGPGRKAVIAIGDNAFRHRLAEQFDTVDWISVIHPNAYVHDSVKIGKGTVVFAGAVIQPDVTIGDHVIINTTASIDHDCQLGNFVHICPGSHLGGTVTLEDGVFLGIGSAIIPNITVGRWTVIGAGSVVIGGLPAYVKAMGVPARPRQKFRA